MNDDRLSDAAIIYLLITVFAIGVLFGQLL